MVTGVIGDLGQVVQQLVDQVLKQEQDFVTTQAQLGMDFFAPKMEVWLMKQANVLIWYLVIMVSIVTLNIISYYLSTF